MNLESAPNRVPPQSIQPGLHPLHIFFSKPHLSVSCFFPINAVLPQVSAAWVSAPTSSSNVRPVWLWWCQKLAWSSQSGGTPWSLSGMTAQNHPLLTVRLSAVQLFIHKTTGKTSSWPPGQGIYISKACSLALRLSLGRSHPTGRRFFNFTRATPSQATLAHSCSTIVLHCCIHGREVSNQTSLTSLPMLFLQFRIFFFTSSLSSRL